jgi:hypothetical protein
MLSRDRCPPNIAGGPGPAVIRQVFRVGAAVRCNQCGAFTPYGVRSSASTMRV